MKNKTSEYPRYWAQSDGWGKSFIVCDSRSGLNIRRGFNTLREAQAVAEKLNAGEQVESNPRHLARGDKQPTQNQNLGLLFPECPAKDAVSR